MSYIYSMVDLWNEGGTTFKGIQINVTNTSSAAASRVMDLQVGGVSQFQVAPNGQQFGVLGTVLLPSISFIGDPNTGFWSAAADTLNASVGGTVAMRLSSTATFFGLNAGNTAVSTGTNNTAFGLSALAANTTGINNTAVGVGALDANTTGSTNIAIGVNVDCDSITASNQINIGNVYRHNRLVHAPATIATLDAFVGLATGTRAMASDSVLATFGATAVGGGANTVPVWYNGAAWIVG
jgi:hypothetical protein